LTDFDLIPASPKANRRSVLYKNGMEKREKLTRRDIGRALAAWSEGSTSVKRRELSSEADEGLILWPGIVQLAPVLYHTRGARSGIDSSSHKPERVLSTSNSDGGGGGEGFRSRFETIVVDKVFD